MVWAGQGLVMVFIVELGHGVVNIMVPEHGVMDIVVLGQGLVDIVELGQGVVDIMELRQGVVDIMVLGLVMVKQELEKAVIILIIRGLVISGSWAGGRHHFTPEKSI